jgi:hypothetical protein
LAWLLPARARAIMVPGIRMRIMKMSPTALSIATPFYVTPLFVVLFL